MVTDLQGHIQSDISYERKYGIAKVIFGFLNLNACIFFGGRGKKEGNEKLPSNVQTQECSRN
jgi:hypothetical protein